MFIIYLDINNKEIQDNLSNIFMPFFSKCYKIEVRNLTIPSFLKEKIEIIKKEKPEIPFEDIKNYLLILTAEPRKFDKRSVLKTVEYTNFMIFKNTFAGEFYNTFLNNVKYFIKNSHYNLRMGL